MEIKLWDEGNIPYFTEGADTPNIMTTYFIDSDKPLPCVVVYPGGGYHHRAYHEGEPVAQFFNSRGINAVVVEYRVAPNRHPAPLADAQRAVKIIRANAEKWNIDADKIVTLGFSAGGHLAASTITLPDVTAGRDDADEIDGFSALPSGAVLCYPVISVDGDFGHTGSGENLLGDRYGAEKDNFCLERRINEKTPQVFLWHTSEDGSVNVKKSLIFGERLRDHGITFEMHIFPHGRHGLGLALEYEDIRKWADLAADWILLNI